MLQHGLARHIAAILLAKAVLLAAIYVLWFSPPSRPLADGKATAAAVLDGTPAEGSAPR